MKPFIFILALALLIASCTSTPSAFVPADILKAIDTNYPIFLENCDLAVTWPVSPSSFEYFPVQDGDVTRVASYYSKTISVGDITVNFHREGTNVFQNGQDITGTKAANEAIVAANRKLDGISVIKLDFTVTKTSDGVITVENFACTAINPR